MKRLKAWVARDEDGMLYLYLAKPRKYRSKWYPGSRPEYFKIDRKLFHEVKWEDEEPTELTFTVKKKDEEQCKTRTSHSSAVGRAIIACLTSE